jgi:hypothetical protein
VGWIGAAGAYLLASAALIGEAGESRDFARRVVPRLNRFCLICALIIPITGIGNLAFVARSRVGPLPSEFLSIVGVKVMLYAVMVWMLTRSTSRLAELARVVESADQAAGATSTTRGLTHVYLVTLAAGSLALLLGLWLAGV